ncbi:Disease resistance protein RPM1 isoform A [Glycine soja]|uniref:Disease resistance protein RPM1 isoform A n=1 Tax=Glycine soja TaxID=3848 RepID=A0A445KGL7_GLYSO|nr:Disease resistance protein RPM1 isoform A [Glycine soja]
MAETAVSISLEEVFQILKKETNLLRGIHKDFSDTRDELESIQTFLKDADRRAAADEANTNDGIRTWVKQVREASFRIEDVVYEYLRGTEEHTVISVVGMGGLGKTTLAKHVFYSEIVKSHFHCRACIKVSQSYTMRGLLIDMIKQFCRETNDRLPQMLQEMDEKSLISKVRQYLKQKRYLIFFDDVWHEDFCDQVEFAMPNNNKSSRIIVTTRVRHVAEFFKKSFLVHVHNLQPLLPDKAWELFCKKAFRFEPDGHCPGELEGISNEIFRKCKGLPMEIVAIGDLLPTKSKTAKEDYSIHHNRLTRQWIAERFVQYDGRTSENVADEYLSELIHRNLVQVSTVGFEGKLEVVKSMIYYMK